MDQYDSVKALWLQIDKLHLSCLETEGTSHRFELKRKLEGCMREYLSLVPVSQRFYFSVTSELLYNSILAKGRDFSSSKFGLAWDALDNYAANLLNYPWRKEFHEIRLYSGGYKHQIESQLLCAEEMLMLMGYTFDIESNRLFLNTVIDPDTVGLISRDCLLAKVESQMLGEIHAALVTRLGSYSFSDIIDYRKRYVGSVAHSIRGLLYQHHQKESLACYSSLAPPIYNTGNICPQELYPSYYCPSFPYQYNPASYPDYHGNFSLPVYGYQSATNDGTSTKEKNTHLQETKALANCNATETPSSTYSGFSLQRDAKLLPKFLEQIDFDTVERLCYEDLDKEDTDSKSILKSVGKEKVSEGFASQLNITSTACPNYDRILHSSSTINGARPKNVKNGPTRQQEPVLSNTVMGKEQSDVPVDRTKQPFVRKQENTEDLANGWECLACTYVNRKSNEICEICAKSRNVGPEVQPLFKGGRECSKCTLVNPREALFCRACAASLHEAPTYI